MDKDRSANAGKSLSSSKHGASWARTAVVFRESATGFSRITSCAEKRQRPASSLPPRVPKGESRRQVLSAAAALGHPI
jgi:hypothetical protein